MRFDARTLLYCCLGFGFLIGLEAEETKCYGNCTNSVNCYEGFSGFQTGQPSKERCSCCPTGICFFVVQNELTLVNFGCARDAKPSEAEVGCMETTVGTVGYKLCLCTASYCNGPTTYQTSNNPDDVDIEAIGQAREAFERIRSERTRTEMES